MARSFFCSYLEVEVELTDEREQHIIDRHPGTLPDYEEQLAQTLADPDLIRSSDRNEKALLFSKWFSTIRTGRFLRLFGLCYAMDWGYRGCNPYVERHLAIFVNCF